MEILTGHETCDHCFKEVDFHSLSSDPDNMVIWYACGHVLIIRNGIVQVVYDYNGPEIATILANIK
jgi:hypothetical protein